MDLSLRPESVRRHKISMRHVLAFCGGEPTSPKIRDFLSLVENPFTYNNYLKSLRVYFQDFLGRSEVVRTFRFCRSDSPSEVILEEGAAGVLRCDGRRLGEVLLFQRPECYKRGFGPSCEPDRPQDDDSPQQTD